MFKNTNKCSFSEEKRWLNWRNCLIEATQLWICFQSVKSTTSRMPRSGKTLEKRHCRTILFLFYEVAMDAIVQWGEANKSERGVVNLSVFRGWTIKVCIFIARLSPLAQLVWATRRVINGFDLQLNRLDRAMLVYKQFVVSQQLPRLRVAPLGLLEF